jgi:MFS family permease
MAAASLPAPSAPPVTQHPLRERNFRMLWVGSGISAVGDQFYLVALPWVVLQLTGSAVAVGTILMAVAIPRALLMLFGGALTDRISARRIMMSTASARTLLVTVIGFLLWGRLLHLGNCTFLAFSLAWLMPLHGLLPPRCCLRW